MRMDIVRELAGTYRETGLARYLTPAETQEFLDRANNVLGWEGGR